MAFSLLVECAKTYDFRVHVWRKKTVISRCVCELTSFANRIVTNRLRQVARNSLTQVDLRLPQPVWKHRFRFLTLRGRRYGPPGKY